MREAKVRDYWNRAYKRPYGDNFVEIDLNGLNGLHKIQVANGITTICGLNGAGKSTIISAIKALIGLPLSGQDCQKLQTNTVYGTVSTQGQIVGCSSKEGERLKDIGWNMDKVVYIDCAANMSTQDYMIGQANLDELLDQYEEYPLDATAIKMLSYLVGKQYDSCEVRELVDATGEDIVIPYFRVSVDGVSYDSKSMGNGEHFLLFLFWCINRVEKDTLLLIEEPETYISIKSQIAFSNYLGTQMAEKGIKVILTTHSPYILNNIKNENVRIVSRVGNNTTITTPDENLPAESILGLNREYVGTFFVEDRVAADLLAVILEDKAPYLLKKYTIDIATGGETAISERLHFPNSKKIRYNFVGVYDGDMRTRLDTADLRWKWCFLPGDVAAEETFRSYFHNPDVLSKIGCYLGKDENHLITILSTIDGADCHDWFEELRKHLSVDRRTLVAAFYQVAMRDNREIDQFIAELLKCLE